MIFIALLLLVLISQNKGQLNLQCQFDANSANEAAKAVGVLAVELYKQVAKPDENIIFSPVSVALALALVESGASGETGKEIRPLLTSPGSPQNTSSKNFQALQHQILHPDVSSGGRVFFDYEDYGRPRPEEKAKLSIANGLFQADSLILTKTYKASVEQCFQTEIISAPFATKPEEATSQVNRWISNATGGKIAELFQPGSISPDTVAILANAVYLKAFWLDRFYESATENLPFYQSGKLDRPQTVRFMVKKDELPYTSKDTYHVIELPYRDSQLSMFIILPKQQDGIEAVEKSLNGQELLSLFGPAKEYRKIILKLPKFIIRQTIDLKIILEKLGVKKMFTGDADFSGMAEGQKIRISSALHEAYIKVHENGTEAAAVTTFMLAGAGPPHTEPPPIPFIADHPFIYAIIHKPTRAIVFMGKVNSVKQEE